MDEDRMCICGHAERDHLDSVALSPCDVGMCVCRSFDVDTDADEEYAR